MASVAQNFSKRDISASYVPASAQMASVVRRQRGSRDLRNLDFHSLDDLTLPSAQVSPRSSRVARPRSLTSSTLTDYASSRDSCCGDTQSNDDPPVSFFDFSDDEHEDENEDEDEDQDDLAGGDRSSPCCWPPSEDWPLQTDAPARRHKDSAVVFDFSGFGFSNPKRGSSSAVTVSSEVSEARRAELAHDQLCLCRYCRQTRHRRRKSSLCLFEKLEDCRHIMVTIRDPTDPRNLERGIAYGHWLKLARLYVKYETLLDSDIEDIAEDEKLLLDYLTSFNERVDLIRAEAKKWSSLFAEQVDVGTASVSGQARVVEVPSTNSPMIHRRAQSWTLSMLGKQGPIGNCRAVGSNFF